MSEPRKRTVDDVRALVEIFAERGLTALEVEQTGFRIRIEAHRSPGSAAAVTRADHVVTSPIVGTFYRSPSPQSAPFVEVGQRIAAGAPLCLIQSSGPEPGLMNEIVSDVEGEIAEVYPRSGQAVEYGEKLFAIRQEGKA